MGAVQLSDKLERVIEREIAEGRAASPTTFLEKAVLHLMDDSCAEDDDIQQAVSAGVADIEAGRYTTVITRADAKSLQERLIVRARLAADE